MGKFQAVARPAIGARVAEAGMVGAIAHWCEFLHGITPFNDALESLTKGLGAEVAVLSRVARDDPRNHKSLQFDSHSSRSNLAAIDRSFAHAVLGTYFEKPKAGSIWFKSMLERDTDPALEECHRRRNLADLVVVPLGINEKSIDFIEIHFPNALKFEHYALLNMVADTLARTWKNRAQGLVTQILSKSAIRIQRQEPTAPILSMENPAKLSRAEYRVCLLLSRGQSFEQAQAELNISPSTLRTHLKNIYAKTDSHSQSELLYRLLTFAPPESQDIEHRKAG